MTERVQMPPATAWIGRNLDRFVEIARDRPGLVLAWVLGLHLIVWTLVPILVSQNLQLDLVEDLALGKEWQLGYWKHPPLPWLVADLLYRLTGELDTIYLLGPLSVVLCCYAVWLLAREVTEDFRGLAAVLALQGIHFYNFSAVKFAHDQMQLPFWAFTGLFFYRAIVRGRLLDWTLAGVFLAGAFWSKYAAVALATTLGLFLLLDPTARRAWRTPGPYVMALAFAIVIAPNAWWLVQHDFMPFEHVNARARTAAHWYEFFTFPLQWIASQIVWLLPAIGLLALLYSRGEARQPLAVDPKAAFDRRYIAALALGPFLVTTAVAAAVGRLPVAMWGYPLWSVAPLAALLWFAPTGDAGRLRRFAGGFLAVFVGFPLVYAGIEIGEPFLRDRPKATQFPGRLLAQTITRQWREATGVPLTYVGGADFGSSGAGEFAANLVAVYSPDRPHVVVHGDTTLSPWVDPTDLERRGAVFVWDAPGLPDNIKARFPRAELQPPLVLPRQTLYPRSPAVVNYAIMRPRPIR